MGHTKTVCQCRGSAAPVENEKALAEHRKSIVSAINTYIEVSVNEGQTATSGAKDSHIFVLSNRFAFLLNEELKTISTAKESALRYRELVITLSELWRVSSKADSTSTERDDAFAAFDDINNISIPTTVQRLHSRDIATDDGSDDLHINGLTRALATVIPVAWHRLSSASAMQNVFLIKHEAAILGDLLDEMTRVMSAVYRCGAEIPSGETEASLAISAIAA
jgi:hypothetical protein